MTFCDYVYNQSFSLLKMRTSMMRMILRMMKMGMRIEDDEGPLTHHYNHHQVVP